MRFAYTPNRSGYTNVGAFRFWCQKALPLVYDDSLSYYELLCKVVEFLNSVIADNREMINKIGELENEFNRLVEFVNNYFDNLDLQEVVDAKLDDMAESGVLESIIAKYIGSGAYVNIAWFAEGGKLNDDNFADCFNAAHQYSSYLYIPKGDYAIHVEVTKDCHILLDADCRITPNDERTPFTNPQGVTSDVSFAIQAIGCSFSLKGGVLYQGVSPADSWEPGTYNLPTGTRANPNVFRTGRSDPRFGSRSSGIIRLSRCKNIRVENVTTPYSDNGHVINLSDCENVTITNCSFDYTRNCAVRFGNTCRNVEVSNCTFKHSYFSMNNADSSWYIPAVGEPVYTARFCYFVVTGIPGLKGTSDPTGIYYGIEPVDGLRYINNYCESSEDSGLDTHGARNVVISGNTILDTVCAITAYNDNLRAVRPLGWRMENIEISNNYCYSLRQKTVDEHVNRYPHPFVFIGSPLNRTMVQAGDEWSFQPTDWKAYSNCVIKNNIFSSVNGVNAMVLACTNCYHVVFENNTFNFLDDRYDTIIQLVNCGAAKFVNNSANKVARINCTNSVVCMENNGLIRLVKVAPVVRMLKDPIGPYSDIADVFSGGEKAIRNNVLYECTGPYSLMMQKFRFNAFSDAQKKACCTHAVANVNDLPPTAYSSVRITSKINDVTYIPGLSINVLFSDGKLYHGYVVDVLNRNELIVSLNSSAVSGDYIYPPLPAGSIPASENQPVYPVDGIAPNTGDNCYIYPRLYDNLRSVT